MGSQTGIEWTDTTWNPVRGCSRVSEGCRHCYAEQIAARFSDPGMPYHGLALRVLKTEGLSRARWTGEVRMVPEHLADPLKWSKPRRIFVNSMSDLFHEKLTNEQIAAVFGVMAAAPQHTFQILTKRAKRMREWFAWADDDGIVTSGKFYDCTYLNHLASKAGMEGGRWIAHCEDTEDTVSSWPLPNVWLGVSVENQAAADERIPELLATPATVRFLSCEPLLGPVNLTLHGSRIKGSSTSLDWVIAGCESGPGARPCDFVWLRSLRDQCRDAGTPFFLKQATSAMQDTRNGASVIGAHFVVTGGPGAHRKPGRIIGAPYLDGRQHLEFPRAPT
jgi:protein gp37